MKFFLLTVTKAAKKSLRLIAILLVAFMILFMIAPMRQAIANVFLPETETPRIEAQQEEFDGEATQQEKAQKETTQQEEFEEETIQQEESEEETTQQEESEEETTQQKGTLNAGTTTAVSLDITLPTAPEAKPLDNLIDTISITSYYDTNEVYAKWVAADNTITTSGKLISGSYVAMYVEWSIKAGDDVQAGDYCTITLPDGLFTWASLNDIAIKDGNEVIAVGYFVQSGSSVELKIVFTNTDYLESKDKISGNCWCYMFFGDFAEDEKIEIGFEINGKPTAQESIAVGPPESTVQYDPSDYNNIKYAYAQLKNNIGGYYYFQWMIYINMDFNIIEDFKLEDTIPADSLHEFITPEHAAQLGDTSLGQVTISEYTGADGADDQKSRYLFFTEQFNANTWQLSANLKRYTLDSGQDPLPGVDGGKGLFLDNITRKDKELSFNLGRVTRPTVISYYTITTVKLDEGALLNEETVKQFENTVAFSTGKRTTSTLQACSYASGGSAVGYNYGFKFNKTDDGGQPLKGAIFYLYKDENCEGAIYGIATSDDSGYVSFSTLKLGTYYLREISAPEGYVLSGEHDLKKNTYTVVLDDSGKSTFSGGDINGNSTELTIINKKRTTTNDEKSIGVVLSGQKKLTGLDLKSGMFSFVVKDEDGVIIRSATNEADGSITFAEITYTEEGVHNYTVAEVDEAKDDIKYDQKVYKVQVMLVDDGDELTATVNYLDGDVVFNNSYDPEDPEDPEDPKEPKDPVAPDPGQRLVPNGSNSYDLIDEDGIPIGSYSLSEDGQTWLFEPYVPMGNLPQTGATGLSPMLLLLLGLALIGVGVALNRPSKIKNR